MTERRGKSSVSYLFTYGNGNTVLRFPFRSPRSGRLGPAWLFLQWEQYVLTFKTGNYHSDCWQSSITTADADWVLILGWSLCYVLTCYILVTSS